MCLQVDISFFIAYIFSTILEVLLNLLAQLDAIIIFNGENWGLDGVIVSLLDFNIGLLVTAIVIGAFVKVSKADNFYSNKKD